MKQQKSHYFKWGLTVFLTVCAILAFYDTFYMNGTLQRYLSKLVTVLAPVLYGFAMAYLLAPIVNWIEGLIRKGLKRLSKGQEPKIRGGLLRGVSILLTWAVVAYLLYLLMSVLIPQLIDSVAMLINNAESYYNKIYVWVTNLLEKNPEIAGWMETNLENYYNDLMKVLTEQVLPGAQQMLTTITGGIWTGIWGLVTFTTNFLVGIIISVYLLAMKEKSLARCCKLLYALLQEEQARWVVRATRKTNQIFSGFVRGKMLDSLIIGILCFIGCSIFSLPYTPLVSVVVGVTNMIPFFVGGSFLSRIRRHTSPGGGFFRFLSLSASQGEDAQQRQHRSSPQHQIQSRRPADIAGHIAQPIDAPQGLPQHIVPVDRGSLHIEEAPLCVHGTDDAPLQR